jgi:hypothetical protein
MSDIFAINATFGHNKRIRIVHNRIQILGCLKVKTISYYKKNKNLKFNVGKEAPFSTFYFKFWSYTFSFSES